MWKGQVVLKILQCTVYLGQNKSKGRGYLILNRMRECFIDVVYMCHPENVRGIKLACIMSLCN